VDAQSIVRGFDGLASADRGIYLGEKMNKIERRKKWAGF